MPRKFQLVLLARKMYLLIYSFIFILNGRHREREKLITHTHTHIHVQIFHLLVHFQNAYLSQGLARLKPGA